VPAVTGVGESRGSEHALLGTPRRDTIVFAVLAVATAVWFVMMANHVTRVPIERFDQAFLRRMIAIRSRPLTLVARFFNFLGLVYVTLPVRIVIAGFLAWRRRWWHMAMFVSAVLVSEACIAPIKALYGRTRPPGALVSTSGTSFPSGHAVAASVTTVAVVIALLPEGTGRYAWGAGAVAFSGVMALSRAYLAAHWLSDAIAGVLIGTSVALGAAVAVHFIRVHREGPGGTEAVVAERESTTNVDRR
jgi:membrane-associated phospholipid phosphatase